MQPHHQKQLLVAVLLGLAFALGVALQSVAPFARVMAAQGFVVDGQVTPANASAPAVLGARLTYQGRLTNSSGAPLNSTVNIVFKLYDAAAALLWTSATRSVTPSNGLFTVYLGDAVDPYLTYDKLVSLVSIGVTVGSDPEMTPRQPLNTVVGHSDNAFGVVGSSTSGTGVRGVSDGGYGVFGVSNIGYAVYGGAYSGFGVYGASVSGTGVRGVSDSADGVYGFTSNPARAGVAAYNATESGIAMEIIRGGIKATGAGGGTHTFAFIHISSGANITGNNTRIDNVLTNDDPDAMLFVTHVANPTGITFNYFNKAFGAYYNGTKWTIYTEDTSGFPVGATFNVMVIKR